MFYGPRARLALSSAFGPFERPVEGPPVAAGTGVPSHAGRTGWGQSRQLFLVVYTLKPGHHHLSVMYGGNADFLGSTGTLDISL
jgi:hypothetical protein